MKTFRKRVNKKSLKKKTVKKQLKNNNKKKAYLKKNYKGGLPDSTLSDSTHNSGETDMETDDSIESVYTPDYSSESVKCYRSLDDIIHNIIDLISKITDMFKVNGVL